MSGALSVLAHGAFGIALLVPTFKEQKGKKQGNGAQGTTALPGKGKGLPQAEAAPITRFPDGASPSM
jgi:hypothetical protein